MPAAPSSALSNPLFRALWLASVGSGVGATVHDTAAVWTLTLTTDKAWVVTLYQSLLSLPLFLLALPAGALADIVDKRVHVLRMQVGGVIVAGAMSALAFAGFLPPGMLLGGAVILGALAAFGMPTWQALMPEVIEKPMMSSAITLGSLGINLSRAIGPFVGGYIVSWFGAGPAFAFNAASFLGLAIILTRWHRPEPPPKPHAETVVSAMIAAVRHVRYSPAIRRVLWRHGLYTFSAFAPVALLPLIVKQMGLPGSTFGLLMGVYGLGGILTAILVMPRLRKRFTVDQLTMASGFVSLASTVALPFASSVSVLAAVLFPAGAAWLVTMAQLNFAGQSVFPHWVRARASAIHLLAVQGGVALGSLLWGDLTERFDLSTALWVAAVLIGLYLFVSRRLPVDRALALDLTPVEHDHHHETLAFEPAHDAGPVRVSVRYVIDETDESDFFSGVAGLRDVRLRDGAYRWHLWRDMEEPRVFWEAFLIGSWQEHLRQGDRWTEAERVAESAVTVFHRGERAPKVEHALHVEPGVAGCGPIVRTEDAV